MQHWGRDYIYTVKSEICSCMRYTSIAVFPQIHYRFPLIYLQVPCLGDSKQAQRRLSIGFVFVMDEEFKQQSNQSWLSFCRFHQAVSAVVCHWLRERVSTLHEHGSQDALLSSWPWAQSQPLTSQDGLLSPFISPSSFSLSSVLQRSSGSFFPLPCALPIAFILGVPTKETTWEVSQGFSYTPGL